ncbi:MAG: hypothetical protein Kow00105_06550 [Phycisphaeraceae bacterium]
MRLIQRVKDTWRKNWPEVHCGLTGGLPGFLFKKKPQPYDPGVPVFCYHVINHDVFQADLSFLKQNDYSTLSADQLVDHLNNQQPAPPRSVVLTFDDGQETLYTVAYPLLKQFGFKAVAFICPGLHRDPNAPDAQPAGGLCDWRQIREMHDSGCIDFQSHTLGHRYIPDWPRPLPLAGVDDTIADRRRADALPLADDLKQSRQELETRLNKPVRHLAFPQYDGTDQAIPIGRQVGYVGFWWGVLPHRPMNTPGDSAERIVRISGEFVRRLPGNGRVALTDIVRARYFKMTPPVS